MSGGLQDSTADARWMAVALRLATRGLGNVWPNPAVGCILVKDGVPVGHGWTRPGGRPHAETEALRHAGAAAADSTAFVSLEPCAHHGKTPPCTDALIASRVARVVTATDDPDPRVAGRGHAQLRAAGIAVTEGVLRDEADHLNAGFFLRIRERRPLVAMKLAQSLDGRIALASGASQWITGLEARAQGHLLRAEHDAVLVGIGTVLADDPLLTCRLPGLQHRSPVRVVVDGHGRLPTTSALARTAGGPRVWQLTTAAAAANGERVRGVERIEVAADAHGRIDVAAALQALAERGVTRLLVEGGARVAGSLMGLGLVDRLHVFVAGRVIGGDGLAAIDALGLEALAEAPRFRHIQQRACGPDRLQLWARAD